MWIKFGRMSLWVKRSLHPGGNQTLDFWLDLRCYTYWTTLAHVEILQLFVYSFLNSSEYLKLVLHSISSTEVIHFAVSILSYGRQSEEKDMYFRGKNQNPKFLASTLMFVLLVLWDSVSPWRGMILAY